METRVALISIIVEDIEAAEKINHFFITIDNISLDVWDCPIDQRKFLL